MSSASSKYEPPVDCMSMVCGAIVMIRFAPDPAAQAAQRLRHEGRVEAVLQVDVDAVEAVRLHDANDRSWRSWSPTAASPTATRPASPPTERMTFLPRACSVATSALKSASV